MVRCKDYVVLLCGSDEIPDLRSSVRDRFLQDDAFSGLERTLFSNISVFTGSTLRHDRLHLCIVILSTVFDGDYNLKPILMYVTEYKAKQQIVKETRGERGGHRSALPSRSLPPSPPCACIK